MRRALTLIELLAVLVILGVASGLGVGLVGPMSSGRSRAHAIASLEHALSRARLLAESRGGAVLELDETISARTTDGTTELTLDLPDSWSAHLLPESARSLMFDSSGACVDAHLALTGPQGARIRLRYLGIPGVLEIIQEPEA